MQTDHHVLQQRHFLEDADVLKGAGNAQARDVVRFAPSQILAVELNAPAGRGQQAGDQVEDGRFAGPVGANQAKDAALRNLQINLLQNPQAAEVARQRVQPQ